MSDLLAQAKVANTYEDQTEVSKGFERSVIPAGFTTARLVGYVEIGKQPQRPYQGKEKPDAPEVRLTFELNGQKHINEYEVDGVKKTRTNVKSEKLKLSTNEKSGYYKLFMKMRNGRDDIRHMAHMLGEGFVLKVVHVVKEKDGKKVTYANIKDADGYTVGAPFVTDPVTDETKSVEVPAATQSIQFLQQANPTKEQWDSIFIDGTWTKKEGDKEVEVSKNFVQALCLEASDFVGSPLESLLGGADEIAAGLAKSAAKASETKSEPKIETIEDEDPVEAKSEETPPERVTEAIEEKPVEEEHVGALNDDNADILADLGLN